MDIRFDFAHLSFLSNHQSSEQYSQIGFDELWDAAQLSGGDHSAFFNGFSQLCDALEKASGKQMDFSNLLSLRRDNGVPNAVYGGAVQLYTADDESQYLALSMGLNLFPVTQSGKILSIGDSFSGEIKLKDDNKRNDNTTYCTLYWEVPISDDFDVIFAIPIRKDPADPKKEKALFLNKDIFKKNIIAANNLADYTREAVKAGKYKNYGTCPWVDGLGAPLRPASLQDGTYTLVGIAHARLSTKENNEEFDSVIGYLADGTRIALNSQAQKDFVANPSSFRFPLQWKVTHLDATRTKSVLCNIAAPTESKTQLPARFAAMAKLAPAKAPNPVKSALIGGSSLDFDKLAKFTADGFDPNADEF